MKTNHFETKLGNEVLSIQIGKIARQANGAVRLQYGATVVLVTAVMSRELREGVDFLPLTVEYQERTRPPGPFLQKSGTFLCPWS